VYSFNFVKRAISTLNYFQAEPGNAEPEDMPPISPSPREADPLEIASQAQPRNQSNSFPAGLPELIYDFYEHN
jgi:hypothetical protein